MFGKHAVYIIPSYALTAVIILALIVWIIMVYRSRLREIAELETKGIVRGKSAKKQNSESKLDG